MTNPFIGPEWEVWREDRILLVGLDEIRPEVITGRDPGDETDGGGK